MATEPIRKGGRRPVEFVHHPDTDDPVDGLRLHRPSQRYYRIGPDGKSRIYYPRDGLKGIGYLRRSIYLHSLQHRNSTPAPEYEIIAVPLPVAAPTLMMPEVTVNIFDQSRQLNYAIPKSAFWAAFRMAIAEDPEGAALNLGLPRNHFRNISFAETMTLTEVGAWYLQKRKKQITAQTQSDNCFYWREFVHAIGDKRVAEIGSTDIDNYYESTYTRFQTEKKSPSWIRNRFGLIRSVIRYAVGKHGPSDEDLQRILAICQNWERPDKEKHDSQPIDPAAFHALLKACQDDPRYTAILHVALSCCMYPIDISQLLIADIDIDRKVIMNTRTKKRTERVCCLSDRCLEAIREYMNSPQFVEDHPNGETALFAWKKARVTAHFRVYREAAGLPDTVKFNQIRDFAYTHAASGAIVGDQVNLDSARILAGHRIEGEVDAYFKRSQSHVRACAARIDAAMFPPEQLIPEQPNRGQKLEK